LVLVPTCGVLASCKELHLLLHGDVELVQSDAQRAVAARVWREELARHLEGEELVIVALSQVGACNGKEKQRARKERLGCCAGSGNA
jgi:hypothetical protein